MKGFNTPDERYRILGSMKITGFGSLIAPSNKPLACIGERGITISMEQTSI